MLKLLFSLGCLAAFAWFGLTVELGERTLFQHLRAIAESRESEELVRGTKEKVTGLLDQRADKTDKAEKHAADDEGTEKASPDKGAKPDKPGKGERSEKSEPAAKTAVVQPKSSDKGADKTAQKTADEAKGEPGEQITGADRQGMKKLLGSRRAQAPAPARAAAQ